jgi:hypothetical protein
MTTQMMATSTDRILLESSHDDIVDDTTSSNCDGDDYDDEGWDQYDEMGDFFENQFDGGGVGGGSGGSGGTGSSSSSGPGNIYSSKHVRIKLARPTIVGGTNGGPNPSAEARNKHEQKKANRKQKKISSKKGGK